MLNSAGTPTFASNLICAAVHLVVFITVAAHLSEERVQESVVRAECPPHPPPGRLHSPLCTFTSD